MLSFTSPHGPQSFKGDPKSIGIFNLNTYQAIFISDMTKLQELELFSDTGMNKQNHGTTDGQTDAEVEIVI